MERQPGWSAAVAPFGRVGCLGASQLAESLARGRVQFPVRRNEHTSGTEASWTVKLPRSGSVLKHPPKKNQTFGKNG